ncbi:MAG: hypothetical protein JXA79_11660 [Deltaproteobacteria bacterium]|nr:hypothetical protein [Deltaproteobacteria bacterium]
MIQKATQSIKQATKPPINIPLKEIQKQFEDWRSTRQKREPIPEALWEAAVGAAQYNPVGRVSRVLRLDHRKLKKRIRARYGDNFFGVDLDAGFIEIDSRQLLCPVECIVETQQPDGARMKMHIKSGNGFNPLEIAKAFWHKRV